MNFIDTLPIYGVIFFCCFVIVIVWLRSEDRKDDNSIDDLMNRKD
jgi:hypothetical protein